MRPYLLWKRLLRGNMANVRFSDAERLLAALGFERVRISGSHHIFAHPQIPAMVNLQEARGRAKPYQLRQVVAMAQRYALSIQEER